MEEKGFKLKEDLTENKRFRAKLLASASNAKTILSANTLAIVAVSSSCNTDNVYHFYTLLMLLYI